MEPEVKIVETSLGQARVATWTSATPVLRLVLTHGAGGGIDARDLVALATNLPAHGVSVCLVEMPWRVQGKKLAPRPPVIDACYREVLGALAVQTPWVLGGRSAGARSACRIGAEMGAAGVLALSFPLHPPGKPEKSRLAELVDVAVATLVVQGERDPFGGPEEFPESIDLAVVPAADHGMKVPLRVKGVPAPLTQDEALAVVTEATLEWIVREVVGNLSE